MKWKDVPNSWFGFPGKLLQYIIDNVRGNKNPDGGAMDYELICPNDGEELVKGICPKCGYKSKGRTGGRG